MDGISFAGAFRTIIFELPEEKAVTGFKVYTVKTIMPDFSFQANTTFYVSENGADWMLAYSYDNSHQTAGNDDKTVRTIISMLNVGRFKAKYVKIKFRVEVNTFIDEIEGFRHRHRRYNEAPFKNMLTFNYKNAYNPGIEG